MAEASQFAVTAIGADQPGIVGAVASALVDVGGNVEDSAMTILGGQFSIMLLVVTEAGGTALEDKLRERTAALGLTIAVSEVASVEPERHRPNPTHVLSVYGEDKPGILAGVTNALADLAVNVTDLETRLLSGGDTPIYAMVVELTCDDNGVLTTALRDVCERLGVDHTLRTLDTETL